LGRGLVIKARSYQVRIAKNSAIEVLSRRTQSPQPLDAYISRSKQGHVAATTAWAFDA